MPSYPVSTTPYKRRRTTYTRRVTPSRWTTYGNAGRQLARDVMYLKTLINSEPHHHYLGYSDNFNWNGLVVPLSIVPQGDTNASRTGDRILPRYLNVRWQVISATGNNVIRVMLFRYWGETPSGAPAVQANDIMRLLGAERAPLSHLNDDITGQKGDRNRRIEVLRNELLNVDLVDRRAVTGDWDVEVNGMRSGKKEHVEYRSSALEEPVSGGFYLLFVGHSETGDVVNLESKMTFYDN